MNSTEWIKQIYSEPSLSLEEISKLVDWLTDNSIPTEQKADVLIALNDRGEKPEEIAAFAKILRDRAVPFPWKGAKIELLDVVGTGGDRLGLINLSTAASIVAAAAGIPVAKHGNKAITSQTGSADVIEALGIPINLTPTQSLEALETVGFTFLFAPSYHPLFRQIGPVRKLCAEKGKRTIFNYLGPLLNPACPAWQVVGVPQPSLCEPIATALKQLGVRRALVVCGEIPESKDKENARYMDELSVLGDTLIAEFHYDSPITVSRLSKSLIPRAKGELQDLIGADPLTNAQIIRDILEARDRSIRRNAVLLNAGAALFVAGKAPSILEGYDLAAFLIDSGLVAEKLAQIIAFRPISP